MNDKRAQFFFLTSLVCLALVLVADDAYRTITLVVSATYALLALASYLDQRSRR
jgi:hypothetical protein